MKKVKNMFVLTLLSLVFLNGCSSLNVGEGLLKVLTSQLGVTDTQALGRCGSFITAGF